MLQAQELIGFDGMLTLVDLSVEAADFGQEMVFPIEDTPHPNYNNPFVKGPDDYLKFERFDPTKATRMKEMLKYCEILMNERGQGWELDGIPGNSNTLRANSRWTGDAPASTALQNSLKGTRSTSQTGIS